MTDLRRTEAKCRAWIKLGILALIGWWWHVGHQTPAPAPITITVHVSAPAQVEPTVRALRAALPELGGAGRVR